MAVEQETGQADKGEFTWVTDKYFAERVPSGAVRVLAEQEAREETEREAAEAAAAEEAAYYAEYYEPAYYAPSQSVTRGNPDGLNSFDGVFEYDGHTETFYASSAVYDAELTVDDDGFWRDSEGRYVVASSDYEKGTEIEISQGKAVVMDDGPESGVVDVHTTWR